jgi:hypothetical protein
MKRTASARKVSRSNAGSISRSANGAARSSYVICVKNAGFPDSLQLRKVYRRLPQTAADRGWWRIIDEEGEDYLYPSHYFIPVTLSPAVARAVSALPD